MKLKKRREPSLPLCIALLYIVLSISWIYYFSPLFFSALDLSVFGLWIYIIVLLIIGFPMSIFVVMGGTESIDFTESQWPILLGIFLNSIFYFLVSKVLIKNKR